MIRSIVLLLTLGNLLAFGQEGGPNRKIVSITWKPADRTLIWEVTNDIPKKNSFFYIRFDVPFMSVDGIDRGFSKLEADNVVTLFEMAEKYAAESTYWWEGGEGDPPPAGGFPKNLKPNPEWGNLDRFVKPKRSPNPKPKNESGVKVITISAPTDSSARPTGKTE